MSYKKANKISWILIILAGFLILANAFINQDMNGPIFYIGLGIGILAVIFSLIFVRCPYCGGRLKDIYISKFCPHCGKKLD